MSRPPIAAAESHATFPPLPVVRLRTFLPLPSVSPSRGLRLPPAAEAAFLAGPAGLAGDDFPILRLAHVDTFTVVP